MKRRKFASADFRLPEASRTKNPRALSPRSFNKKHVGRRHAAFLIGVYIALMWSLLFLASRFVDRAIIESFLEPFGLAAPAIFVIFQVFYVIFVPIYNTPIHLAAGFIFGGWWGFVINYLGTTIGLFIIVLLVKRFGRPLLERVVLTRTIRKYDKIAQQIGPLFLFVAYVLPVFPDDELTYVVAAAQVRFRRFVPVILLGNIPKAAVSFIGADPIGGIKPAITSRIIVLFVGLAIFALIRVTRQIKRSKSSSHPRGNIG